MTNRDVAAEVSSALGREARIVLDADIPGRRGTAVSRQCHRNQTDTR
jgi:hypothetical protein